MTDIELINSFVSNSKQMMWFLGAGTSRSAGLPTATDLIWDLKLKLYCREENQDIKSHDINNEVIKNRIQGYMDSKGYPSLWSAEEYSFYFEKAFGSDYGAQQQYLAKQLGNEKTSLNVGHKVLAGLMAQNDARVVFTTNFDEVIESAFAKVSGESLSSYNLEGSYAVLDALNSERFPIYAKIHGDFKFRSVKNLSSDLLDNDKKIQQSFLAASIRFGLIVSGYSGRDNNVMSMFNEALDQNNAFPFGIFWTVTSRKGVLPVVEEFIEKAKNKGINAHIVEAGTFDSMLAKIWRQMEHKNPNYDSIIRNARSMNVNIPMGDFGTGFPIIRTNAFPIVNVPSHCAHITTISPLSNKDVKDRLFEKPSREIISKMDKILAWGNPQNMSHILGENSVQSISQHEITNPIESITKDKGYHSFFQRALIVSLIDKKPIELKNNRGFFLCIDPTQTSNPIFEPLKKALADRQGNWGYLSGKIPNSNNAFWREAVSAKMEVKNNKLWLVIKPTLWVDPREERRNHAEFLKSKRRFQFNQKANDILDAWISILFNNPMKGSSVKISCMEDDEYPIHFEVQTRTAFSKK